MSVERAVAIVGIGCRFPGGVSDAAGFWRLLSEGRDAITEIPPSRVDLQRFFDPRPATPGRMMTRWGGYLDDIEDFDPYFFGISPREAERLDPQQRLLLETAWEAFEDAGQDVHRLDGSDTGVYVGQWLSDFEGRLFTDPEKVDFQMTTGSGRYAASGRVSYAFGLRGPSLTLDTACSSSLVAVHLAARSIRSGECSLALAGGVNVILQPHIHVAYSQSRMMAPDGRCKFGDASGDGYVRSEGAALILLKALDRALADGDRIYALVRGSAVNNDGRSSGSMGTPSRIGQEELLRSAYRDAGVSPGRVGYIEAHGTGTRAGDPVELAALGAVLSEGREPNQRARVGSVKTNIGHTEGAAGIAGLIKVALSLHHASIAPSLHCKTPTTAIDWPAMPLELAREGSLWPDSGGPRIGGVSAFGIAGTNAHVVLEQAPLPADLLASDSALAKPAVLPLSARSPAALRELAARHAQMLALEGGVTLASVCWNTATRRTPLEHRAVFVAADRAGMAEALHRYAVGGAATAEGSAADGTVPKLAFVVPGQGAQWVGMGRELLASEPVFKAALERCDAAARPHTDWSILDQLAAESGSAACQLDRIDVIQPVLVALAIAYAALWRSLGVEPDAVVGHSMGEVGAAHIAGVLGLDDAMKIICRRSALMRRTSGQGAMALVELSNDDALTRIRGHENTLSVAVSNSPRSSVISGDPQALKTVMAELEADQIFCRLVKVDVASHSPQMEPLAAELRAELAGLAPLEAQVPIYSTVLGRQAEAHEFGADYWGRNLRQPVLFMQTVDQLLADGVTTFVELGPHPVLLPSVQETAQPLDRSVATVACALREEPATPAWLAAIGALWASGARLDWSRIMPPAGRVVSLPLYPWQRERHWATAAERDAGERVLRRDATPTPTTARHPLLGPATEMGGSPPGCLWEAELDLARSPQLGEHRLHGAAVLAASVYLELALAAATRMGGADNELSVESLSFEQALYLPADSAVRLQLQAAPEGAGFRLVWQGGGPTGWTRHAGARLVASEANPEQSDDATTINRLRSRASSSGSQIYERLEASGAGFGAALRGIGRAWMADGEAFAELVAPTVEGPPLEHFEIAPAALDACFQLGVASIGDGELWMPTGITRVYRRRTAGTPEGLLVRSREPATDGSRCIDITLMDSAGAMLQLDGVRLTRLSGQGSLDPRQWLLQLRWNEAPRAAHETAPREWVLLAGRSGLAPLLAARLRDGGAAVTVVPMNEAELALPPREAGSLARVEVVDLRGTDIDTPTPQTGRELFALVRVIQQLNRFDGAARRCWCVTRGARAVVPEDAPVLALCQAALWGIGAAAAEEHPGLWGACIDLDATISLAEQATQLHDELVAGRPGDSALRNGRRLVPQWQRIEAPDAPAAAVVLRRDASYLVTGGLGGIGLQVARWLIERGARRLVILGRTPLPGRARWADTDPRSRAGAAIAAIRALEALGASVHHAAVDVADEAQLEAFVETFRSEGWPAIRGVVHAAGVIDDRLLADLDPGSLQQVLGGKLFGAWHLDRLFPELDHFVLFSSVAAPLAQPGQASYAAANAFLDALAHQRRSRGQAALSINWGVWAGIGFAGTEGGAQALDRLARYGIGAFPVEGGLAALGLLMEQTEAQAAVLPIDATALRHALAAGVLPAAAATLLAPLAAGGDGAAANEGTKVAESFAEQLRRQEAPQRQLALEERLIEQASAILRLSAGRLDRRAPLGSFGLNSLMALELRNRIEHDLGLPLSATVLWNYPSVAALATYLLTRLVPVPKAEPGTPPPATTPADLARPLEQTVLGVEALSDAAALAALARPARRSR
ncbi:MAG: type I polyketide synthase [Burkholderiales bacterium]